jgi:transposase
MRKKYKVKLTPNQREQLLKIVHNGSGKAKEITHARILLQADSGKDGPGLKAKVIAANLNIHERTVHRVRERFANDGIEVALHRKKHRQHKPRKLDGEQEAHLVALCCSVPPEGRKEWTLSLLSNRLVQLEITDSISRSTVHRTLKKMNLSLG